MGGRAQPQWEHSRIRGSAGRSPRGDREGGHRKHEAKTSYIPETRCPYRRCHRTSRSMSVPLNKQEPLEAVRAHGEDGLSLPSPPKLRWGQGWQSSRSGLLCKHSRLVCGWTDPRPVYWVAGNHCRVWPCHLGR